MFINDAVFSFDPLSLEQIILKHLSRYLTRSTLCKSHIHQLIYRHSIIHVLFHGREIALND